MGDGSDAAVEGGVRLGVVRVAVAGGDRDPAWDEDVDEVERPGQLGCEREQSNGPGGKDPLEQLDVRVTPCGGRMRPKPPGRDKRALYVRPKDARAASALTYLPERGHQPVLGGGDQRRQVRSDAGLEQRLAGALVARRVGVEEVDAAEAVHLEVDEPGAGDPASVPGRKPVGGHPTVDH